MRIKHSQGKITITHSQITCQNCIPLRAGKKELCPAEVGSLDPMFKKSATELEQKQKLLKCKSTIQIATFNVRTLNRIGQLPELTPYAIDHNMDIVCVQERRYLQSEDIKYHDTGNGWTLVSTYACKNSVNAAIRDVSMLISPQALKSLNSIDKIQPRMMVATFNRNPSTTIISCDSPTNVI